MCRAGHVQLGQIKRFDMAGFNPRIDWVREMIRYGIVDASARTSGSLSDPYTIEQAYWESLWYRPPSTVSLPRDH